MKFDLVASLKEFLFDIVGFLLHGFFVIILVQMLFEALNFSTFHSPE